jgi:hypothetical protein
MGGTVTGPEDTPVPASQQSRGPTITIDGLIGELLAAAWYQGVLPARVTVSGWERWKSRGHGVELFRDPQDGSWSLIAVNHPWTGAPTQTVTVQKGTP